MTLNKKAKWQKIYYILAGFDLLTILISLILNHNLVSIYRNTVNESAIWTQRQGLYHEIGTKLLELNSPGNNVFESLNPEQEAKLLEKYEQDFNKVYDKTWIDLERITDTEQREVFRKSLKEVEVYATEIVENAETIFTHLSLDDKATAGGFMARMDQSYAKANEFLSTIVENIQQHQLRLKEKQLIRAKELSKIEYVIASFIFFIIFFVLLYGKKLNQEFTYLNKKQEDLIKDLEESQQRFDLAVKGSFDGLWDWNILTNEVWYSPRFKEQLGYQEDEFPNQFESWKRTLHPEDIDATLQALDQHFKEDIPYDVEYRCKCKTGKYCWFRARGIALKDASGKPVRMAGFLQDITESKRYEQKLEMVFDTSPLGILLVNTKGIITLSNQSARDLFGYTKEELMNQPIEILVPDAIKSHHVALRDGFLKTPTRRAMGSGIELHGQTKNGEEIVMEVNLEPLVINDAQVVLVNILDIRKRKETEQKILEESEKAKAANKAKGDFLANMSHEIRTPLNAILGFSDLLTQTNVDDTQMDYLKTIRESGDLLLEIISDILDLSKIESSQVELESLDFDLERLVEGVIQITKAKVAQKPIEMNLYCDATLPRYLKGDPTRLRQVILNLLGNASKFTEEGEISVFVRDKSKNIDGKHQIEVTVKDTGIGIPKDKQEAIFESFQQADMSTTRKFGGTGLGLAITKKLIELMEGEVRVDSKEGVGSEFIFTVFLEEAENTDKVYPASLKSLKDKKIWIVDDNPSARIILSQYMTDLGSKVLQQFERAKDLLDALKQEQEIPDLILSDVMMPEMDGYQLAKKLQKLPQSKKWKIIAITSDVLPGTAKKANDAGFDGYLPKPIIKEDLVHVIQMVFGIESPKKGIVTKHLYEEISLKGIKVLVAEDNPVNVKLIKLMLDKMQCDTDCASNGEEAIKALESNEYDICFMDLQMPVMGGIEASKIIRNELKKDIPIIALTAAVLTEDRAEALEVGMNDFLTKPLSATKLHATILNFVHIH